MPVICAHIYDPNIVSYATEATIPFANVTTIYDNERKTL